MNDQTDNKTPADTPTNNGSPRDTGRRNFLTASAAGLAAASAFAATGCANPNEGDAAATNKTAPAAKSTSYKNAPFDSLRDYMEALIEAGLVFRVARIDQDNYELSALTYRLIDEYGWYDAPAIMVDEIKIDGKWVKGPLIVNHHGHLETEAIIFGIENVPGDSRGTYRRVIEHLQNKLVKGNYPRIAPVEVPTESAPCKQVINKGDDIDLTQYAFIQSNPGDSRRYVNTGSVYTTDPEMGMNFGTYRCELRGPKLLGVNPEPNQTGWKMLMAAKERGEKTAKIAIAVGQDPTTWIVSGSRVVNRITERGPIDEHAVSGGIRGKAIDLVKCEMSDIMVPANSEMIIEGEVPLNESLPEGPFGEMYGYLGEPKDENFFMNITCITHRTDPWLVNQFTGATRGYATAPTAALYNTTLKGLVPGLIEIHSPVESTGLSFVRIKKTKAGEGLKAGQRLAKIIPIFKVVVVVDEDVDVMDTAAVGLAIGARIMPGHAVDVFSARGMPLDPSLDDHSDAGKLIIDATRQFPEEGGRETFPKFNRDLLEELAPQSFDLVDERLGQYIEQGRTWQGPVKPV